MAYLTPAIEFPAPTAQHFRKIYNKGLRALKGLFSKKKKKRKVQHFRKNLFTRVFLKKKKKKKKGGMCLLQALSFKYAYCAKKSTAQDIQVCCTIAPSVLHPIVYIFTRLRCADNSTPQHDVLLQSYVSKDKACCWTSKSWPSIPFGTFYHAQFWTEIWLLDLCGDFFTSKA